MTKHYIQETVMTLKPYDSSSLLNGNAITNLLKSNQLSVTLKLLIAKANEITSPHCTLHLKT